MAYIQKNVALSKHTTMQVGGPASFFMEACSVKDLEKGVQFAQENNIPFFVFGGGSNIVVSDDGYKGLVIKVRIRGINFSQQEDGNVLAIAGAGEVWDEFVEHAVERNLYGIENLSFIPGSVGAAPIQNIGAYGSEARETIAWVEVFDAETSTVRRIKNEECDFTYRDSLFKKKPHYIVTCVAFLLRQNGKVNIAYKDLSEYFKGMRDAPPSLQEVRDAVISIRKRKLVDPKEIANTGSFFKNPLISKADYEELLKKYPGLPGYQVDARTVKIPLAFVLDAMCGLKGIRRGNVGLCHTQPLVIVHYGGGTAQEIRKFANGIRSIVKEKIGIMPEYEVSFIGFE